MSITQYSWRTSPLGELCDIVAGGTPRRTERRFYDGGIPWVKISDMLQDPITTTEETISHEGLDNSAAKLLPQGTLLISIFATIGRTAILGVPATTNQAIVGVRPRVGSDLNVRYLRRFLDHSVGVLASQARGVAQANVNGSILKSLMIPVPPLPEQKRIADILDKADAIRRKRREVSATLKSLREGLFLTLFGDPLHNPMQWPRVRLGELVSPTRAITYGILKPGEHVPDGIPMLRIQDIDTGQIRTRDLHRVSQALSHQYRRTILDGTELVISLVGTIGLVAMVPDSLRGANVHRNLGVIVPGPQAKRTYLHALMNLPRFAALLRSSIKGGNQALLNLGALEELMLPLPSLEVQDRYEQHLAVISKLSDKAFSAHDEARNLFDCLVQRAFRGEL